MYFDHFLTKQENNFKITISKCSTQIVYKLLLFTVEELYILMFLQIV